MNKIERKKAIEELKEICQEIGCSGLNTANQATELKKASRGIMNDAPDKHTNIYERIFLVPHGYKLIGIKNNVCYMVGIKCNKK